MDLRPAEGYFSRRSGRGNFVADSGQVEGQINRLKTIKRQMYGRAGFEILRARVLPYCQWTLPDRPHELHQNCGRALF